MLRDCNMSHQASGDFLLASVMSYALTSHTVYEMTLGQHELTDNRSRDAATKSGLALVGQLDELMSKEVEKKIALVNGLILIPLLTLLGVPGNIASAVVFCKQGLRERVNFCLFALAIIDLFVVLILFLPNFERQIRAVFLPYSLHPWIFATYAPGLMGFVRASQFLSAVIASERCFCVVSPFHAKRLLKTSTMAAIIVVCSCVLIAGYCGIAGPKHDIEYYFDPVMKVTRSRVYFTRYYLENKDILDIFDIYVYATFLPGLFLLVIVITTVITVISLHSAVLQRQSMTRANDSKLEKFKSTNILSSKEVGVTQMLIGTSVLFIICLSPHVVGQVTTFILPELSFSGKYYNINMFMWSLVSLFRVISCSVNICVYYALGSKFRQSFRELCGFSCGKVHQNNKKSTTVTLKVVNN